MTRLAPRRRILRAALAVSALAIVRPAAADELEDAIRTYTAGAPLATGRVAIDIARLVDNGNSVPVTIRVASPMNATDRVVSVALFNERNPERDVVRVTFGPRAARAVVSTRIRLATSQKLVAVARMADGSFHAATVNVLVTLAACIEGDP